MTTPSTQTNRRILTLLAAAATSLLVVPSGEAATVVDWGGDYVTENQEFQNEVGTGAYGGFVDGDPLQINPADSYSGTSADFYGQVLRTDGSTEVNKASQVVNSGTNDLLFLKGHDSLNTAFLVLWQQADFLNGYNTGSVDLDSNSSIRLNIDRYVGQEANDSGRIVLRLNESGTENYYISDQVFTGVGDFVETDLLNLGYYEYDPASALGINSGSLISADIVDGGLISGVSEVGFYFESGIVANRVDILDFEVNAVPEPTTAMLMLGGVGMLALRRRR